MTGLAVQVCVKRRFARACVKLRALQGRAGVSVRLVGAVDALCGPSYRSMWVVVADVHDAPIDSEPDGGMIRWDGPLGTV